MTRAILAALLGAALQSSPAVVEPGFTSLFDGKDLAGWKVGGSPEAFSVQDGAIVTTGPTSHLYYDGGFRNHAFRNFELMVDVMTRAGANGGIYVLTEYESSGGNVRATGRFPSKGFEIQVNNSHTDPVRTGSLYHVSDVVGDSPVKDDEWFTEHIIVSGDTITVNVNGKQVVRWTQPADWDGGREGPGRRITGPGTIALQCHDPKSTVYYRNIRIKPLD
jgi:hypothetical protein